MWTRFVGLAVVPVGLFVASRFTHIGPGLVAAGLFSMAVGLVVGYVQMSARFLGPAGRPPPLTGPPVAKAGWLSGAVGKHRIRKGIWVTVYADRLVIGISYAPTRTVMADQLGPISTHGTPRPEIQIEHRSPGLVSPLTLRLPEDHPVPQALTELVSR